MPEIALRPHQEKAVDALRDRIRQGQNRLVLCAPTGSGKTLTSAYLIQEAQRKGKRAVFVVDRTALVGQTSKVFWEYGIHHGVAQGENTFGRGAHIQIASAQTLERRGYWPDADLVVIDECHSLRKKVCEFIKTRAIPVIGLTATPFTNGMGDVYDGIVNVTTTDQLIADGWLADLKVYAAKQANMKGAKIVGGEWSAHDIEERGAKIIGDIVQEWVEKTHRHFGGPVKTLVFSATVDHGAALCQEFQAAGYAFEQISYKDSNDARREALIDEFRRKESDIIGLVSCEALAKGFDVPDVQCVISARPYRKSLAAHIQQIGRGMRQSPDKEFCLLLDHAGNWLRFASQVREFFANGATELIDGRESPQKEPTAKERKELVCSCGYVLPPKSDRCPGCGKERKRKQLESAPGEMVAIGQDFKETNRDTWRQICRIGFDRKKGDIALAERFAKAQYKNLVGAWPPYAWGFDPCRADAVHPALERKVKSQIIRFMKARAA